MGNLKLVSPNGDFNIRDSKKNADQKPHKNDVDLQS